MSSERLACARLGALFVAAGLALAGSASTAQAFDGDASDGQVDLVASRNLRVGNVFVSNNDLMLTVSYVTLPGWCLTDTQLHVAFSRRGIPHSPGGTWRPNRFQHSRRHGCVRNVTYNIPLTRCSMIYVATHGVVRRTRGDRRGGAAAWGHGRIRGRRPWRTAFTFTPLCDASPS